jgi:protein associated with RNAse G/E
VLSVNNDTIVYYGKNCKVNIVGNQQAGMIDWDWDLFSYPETIHRYLDINEI